MEDSTIWEKSLGMRNTAIYSRTNTLNFLSMELPLETLSATFASHKCKSRPIIRYLQNKDIKLYLYYLKLAAESGVI